MSSSNWWANKMGAPQSPPTMPPVTPPQPTTYNPVPQQQPQFTQGLPPTVAAPAPTCPNCRSGNYGSADPNVKARCYDCGYPVVQSASSTPGIGSSQSVQGGNVQRARQISTANNYNPQGIIGKL